MTRLARPAIHLLTAALVAWGLSIPEGEYGRSLAQTLWFGLFSTLALYFALLVGPLVSLFPNFPGGGLWLHARRALGISSAVFAALHAWFGFFGWVGGFDELSLWTWDYHLSLFAGLVALVIVLILAATSFDRAVALMGAGWKRLHRWVHVAALLVFAHVVSVTIHVLDLLPWQVGWFVAVALLMALEAARFGRRGSRGRKHVAALGLVVGLALLTWSTFLISHHRH